MEERYRELELPKQDFEAYYQKNVKSAAKDLVGAALASDQRATNGVLPSGVDVEKLYAVVACKMLSALAPSVGASSHAGKSSSKSARQAVTRLANDSKRGSHLF